MITVEDAWCRRVTGREDERMGKESRGGRWEGERRAGQSRGARSRGENGEGEKRDGRNPFPYQTRSLHRA